MVRSRFAGNEMNQNTGGFCLTKVFGPHFTDQLQYSFSIERFFNWISKHGVSNSISLLQNIWSNPSEHLEPIDDINQLVPIKSVNDTRNFPQLFQGPRRKINSKMCAFAELLDVRMVFVKVARRGNYKTFAKRNIGGRFSLKDQPGVLRVEQIAAINI